VGQLEDVDDAAGFEAPVDDPLEEVLDESAEPEGFCEDPEDPLDLSDDEPEPLVAEPAVTDDPERESVR
jgi:hypothetical protein